MPDLERRRRGRVGPEFVQRTYPRDRAHGFAPGDLRGVYAVFVPADSAKREPGDPGR